MSPSQNPAASTSSSQQQQRNRAESTYQCTTVAGRAMAEARAIGSLPVANVQELAETFNNGSHDRHQVPDRYLVKDATASSKEVVVSGDDSLSAIPVIDFAKLLDPRSSSSECAKLASACHDWGFFQLINHGVPTHVSANIMHDVDKFLKQPLEAKKAVAQQPGSLEGYGQAFVVSEEQKLDWDDMLYLQVEPREARDLRFWPTQPASFGRSVDAYSSEVARLSCRLLEFMAKGAGADPASLLRLFAGQRVGMRVNYYPPCRHAADRVLGLSPHTDACGLTLLRQRSDDVQGLQIRKDGKWFAVDVLDGAFVVNVGDGLEVLSNGKLRSVEHRAVIHPSKDRISVAMFQYPCQDLTLGPLPEFVTKGDRARYRSTSYKEFMTQYFTAKLDGKNHLERLKFE